MSGIKTCVSLYSLQDEYLNKRMGFLEIMKFLKDNGVEGFEILPDQMLHGAPHLSDETLKMWDTAIAETGLKPVIADIFLNTNLYKNRTLTKKECVDLLVDEVKMAKRLGIPLLRLVSMVPGYVLESLLPYLEEYQVTVALEIHAAMAFDIPQTRDFVAEMKRLDSPYIGLVIDTGIFCRKFPRVTKEYSIATGVNPEIFEYIEDVFAKGKDMHMIKNENHGKYPADFTKLLKTELDHMFAATADGYENLPYEVMDEHLPYIKHFHFKLYEMIADVKEVLPTPEEMLPNPLEYSMKYDEILKYLDSKGYTGYVSTEYEGNRFTLPGHPMREKEQVLAHQNYIRMCLKEIMSSKLDLG